MAWVLSDAKEWLLIVLGVVLVRLGVCNRIDWVVYKQQTFLFFFV